VQRRQWLSTLWIGVLATSLVVGAALIIAIALPAAPLNSAWWDFASSANPDVKEKIGWPELTDIVAQIYDALPEQEKAQTGIFTNNYGEAGAINMYGPDLGLPMALSGVNSYWLRGYGENPPQTLIVVGYYREDIGPYFESCTLAGEITNRYGVENEESKVPDIFICRGLRESWEDFWQHIHHFG
jgi:hypothetical protein